jgi:hypothetical protein
VDPLTLNTVAWLLALCALPRAGIARACPSSPPPGDTDFMDAVARHRVAPLALRRISELPVMRGLEPTLLAAQAGNARRALISVARLSAIGDAFARANVPWCVLKGVPLARRHYGDIAARHVGDIDLLVAPDRVIQADAALRSIGWRRFDQSPEAPLPPLHTWHEQHYVDGSELRIELHHRLHPNPHLVPVATRALLADVEPIDLGGVTVPVLGAVIDLLYLATHGCRHGWYRLMWVHDLAVISRRASPYFAQAVEGAARRLGLLLPVAQGLLLADELCAVRAPAWARDLGARSPRLRTLMAFARESLWGTRDAAGNPTERTGSSLLSALYQRSSLPYWAWEIGLRIRHEVRRLAPA